MESKKERARKEGKFIIYYVPGTILEALYHPSYLILTTPLGVGSVVPISMAETLRGKVTCQRSHSLLANRDSNSGLSDYHSLKYETCQDTSQISLVSFLPQILSGETGPCRYSFMEKVSLPIPAHYHSLLSRSVTCVFS